MQQQTMFSLGSSGLPRWLEGLLGIAGIAIAVASFLTVQHEIQAMGSQSLSALVILFLGSLVGWASIMVTLASVVRYSMKRRQI